MRKPSGRFPSGGRLVICFMDGRSGTLGLGGIRAAAVAPTSLGVQMVSAVIRSIGWGLLAALIHSMVGDAIEYGHWRTGHKVPGTT